MTTQFEREIRAAFAERIPAEADPALATSIHARLAIEPVIRRGTGPTLGRSGLPAILPAAVLAAVVIVVVAVPLIGHLRPPAPSTNPGQIMGASPSTSASPSPVASSAATVAPAPGNIPLSKNMFGDAVIVRASLVTDTVGWVATRSALYRTADAGRTWTEVRSLLDSESGWSPIYIVDADTAYVPLGTRIAATHDGGASWSESTINADNNGSLGVGPILTFRTASIGAATFESIDPGQPGRLRVFQTSDGGTTWVDRGTSVLPDGEVKLAPTDGNVLSLNLGKADNKPFNDHLWLSMDGGHTWKPRTFPIDAVAKAGALKWVAGTAWIDSATGRIVLPVSDGDQIAIYDSSDDGQTWRLIDHRPQSLHENFDVQLRSATDWVLAAPDGSQIVSTADGGAAWRTVTATAPVWGLETSWASQDHGWAVDPCPARPPVISHGPDPWCDGTGLKSVLFETRDGGRTWVPIGG